MTRPKLLFFVSEDWYFCSHRLPLAVAASEAGFDVGVVTRVRAHEQRILAAGLRVIPFEMSRRGMHVLEERRVLARLTEIYRRERPDLVHQVAMKPVIYGSLAARRAGVGSVVNALAGMGWLFTSERLTARLIKPFVSLAIRSLLRTTHVIVQNPDDAALMNGLGLKYVHLIPGSGVDTDLFAPVPEPSGTPLVILPARMLRDKGVDEFVAAAKRLKERRIDARFALVGAPDFENPAAVPAEQLAAWRDTGVIEWWGQRDDMAQVYAHAHIVCLPSYREGLPKVLLEAAASGRPIVTSDAPGCREIVRHEDNGLLVAPRDVAALTEALARLIGDPVARRRMGERGRQRVLEEFSLATVIAETLALYREALS